MGKPHKAPQKYDMPHEKHGKKDDDDGMPQQVPVPGAASSSAINTTASAVDAPASPSSVSSSLVFFVILAIAGAFLYRRYYRDRRKHWKYSQVAGRADPRLRRTRARAHTHARTHALMYSRTRSRAYSRTRSRTRAPRPQQLPYVDVSALGQDNVRRRLPTFDYVTGKFSVSPV